MRYRLDPFAPAGIAVLTDEPAKPAVVQSHGYVTHPVPVRIVADDPATGNEGDLIYNTTSSELKIYVNGAWTAISGGGAADAASFDFVDGTDFMFIDGTGFDFIT